MPREGLRLLVLLQRRRGRATDSKENARAAARTGGVRLGKGLAGLEESFRAFANCSNDIEQQRLEQRLEFFARTGLRSKKEVENLPKHTGLMLGSYGVSIYFWHTEVRKLDF